MNIELVKKTPIIDLNVVIQGEGSLAGKRSILIRTSGCNLRCKFKNSICDTPYSSFKAESKKYLLEDIDKIIKDNPSINYIILTGGEPTMYPEFIKHIRRTYTHHHITIETNGTLLREDLYDQANLWSISPKMLSTVDQTMHRPIVEHQSQLIRTTPIKIANLIVKDSIADIQLKYVVANEEDVKESIRHLEMIEQELGEQLDRDMVYLMAAGANFDELCQTRPIIGDLALKYGFSLTDRIHINFWNDKREA